MTNNRRGCQYGVLSDYSEDVPLIGRATRLLFDNFPIDVGVPRRFNVDTDAQFRHFLREMDGDRNIYASIADSSMVGDTLFSHTVTYDLDSPIKTKDGIDHDKIGEDMPLIDIFDVLMRDSSVADDLLGPCIEDARKLVEASKDDGIPCFAVFTGLGIHFHQLFQRISNPKRAMKTTARKYISDNDVKTADVQVVGDSNRIVRVPNRHRVDAGGRTCGVFTIPVTASEIDDWTPSRFFAESRQRRNPEGLPTTGVSERPELEVYPEHEGTSLAGETYWAEGKAHEPQDGEYDDEFKSIVESAIAMPCLRAAVFDRNPSHKARLAIAISLFNSGYSRQEVLNLMRELPWKDFDPSVTKRQLDNIWEGEYSSISCEKMMMNGHCVKEEDPESCPSYADRGGLNMWDKYADKGLIR